MALGQVGPEGSSLGEELLNQALNRLNLTQAEEDTEAAIKAYLQTLKDDEQRALMRTISSQMTAAKLTGQMPARLEPDEEAQRQLIDRRFEFDQYNRQVVAEEKARRAEQDEMAAFRARGETQANVARLLRVLKSSLGDTQPQSTKTISAEDQEKEHARRQRRLQFTMDSIRYRY